MSLLSETAKLMEAGRVAPATGVVFVALFLAALASVPVLQGLDEWRALQRRPDAPVLTPWQKAGAELPLVRDAFRDASGAWYRPIAAANARMLPLIKDFEDNLEDQSWLARELREPTQWFLTRWLGAGNEQAYPGANGWVYYRSDVDYVTGPGFLNPRHLASGHGGLAATASDRHHDPVAAIVEFDRALRRQGITLLLMPIPVKPTLHPAGLYSRLDPFQIPLQNPSFDRFVKQVGDAGVRLFDSAQILKDWSQFAGHPAYLAGDTHWRPEAMGAVAKSLATEIRALDILPSVPPAGYQQGQTQIANFGDTTAMLGLPSVQDRFAQESVSLAPILDAEGRPWQRTPGADVLVLGDSFANIFSQPSMGWGASAGLVERLAFHLQRPVDRIVQNDNGAFATREMLVNRLAEKSDAAQPPPRIVIWEFTQRELALGGWKLLE